MDLSLITVQEFKDLFYRDFPYLPSFDEALYYNVGDVVYYSTTRSFYVCIQEGIGNLPTDILFWSRAIGESLNDYVLDLDITKAFAESKQMFNQGLFGSVANITIGYLYLSAHFLAYDLRTSKQGVNSFGSFNIERRKVGNVEESYCIPPTLVNSPIYSFYTKTGYGMKYLNMVLPKLTGHMALLEGTTTPSYGNGNELQGSELI